MTPRIPHGENGGGAAAAAPPADYSLPAAGGQPALPQRIAAIRTFLLEAQLPEALGWAQGRFAKRHTLFVQVVTDGGLEGWGECAGPSAVNQAAIHDYLAPKAIGRDALRTDAVWHQLWQASQPWGRRGAILGALSGLDIALWDLRGRALGLPVSELLGGRLRDRVPCYATGLYFRDHPETEIVPAMVREAETYAEQGYRAIKAQLGRNPIYDRSLARALRQALPDTTLFADASHGYDLPEALRLARVLADEEFAWFEDPVSLERPAQMRQIFDISGLPIASGKTEQTAAGFQALLAPGGVAYAQPTVTYCGGLSEAVRIRTVAAAMGVTVVPHTGSNTTMLGLAATLHLVASTFRHPGRKEATLGYLERSGAPNPLRDALFSRTLNIDDGSAAVPTAPGLGVVVDEAEMRSFCISARETAA